MPAWALRLGATASTLLVMVASAAYVTTHVRNPLAPLHPPIAREPIEAPAFRTLPTPAPRAGATAAPAARNRLNLTPNVRVSDLPPLTTTYVS